MGRDNRCKLGMCRMRFGHLGRWLVGSQTCKVNVRFAEGLPGALRRFGGKLVVVQLDSASYIVHCACSPTTCLRRETRYASGAAGPLREPVVESEAVPVLRMDMVSMSNHPGLSALEIGHV
jgi:hypothetical protein